MRTIFVQIAAYRDPELLPTIRDCLAKATRPDDLRFGICWQRDSDDRLEPFIDDARFRVISVPYRSSKGVCWARNAVQSLYDGETYTLQLDSHHRFAPGWDDQLVEMLHRTKSEKPLLTTYVTAYDPLNDALLDPTPWRMAFERFTPDGVVFVRPQPIPDWQELDAPVPARFYSAHFAFTLGAFATEVRHDPELYFHGEEMSVGIRAFTHGYDLFHPHRTVVWHEYTRRLRRKHWDDHSTAKNGTVPWTERDRASLRRNRILFGMESGSVDFGLYGFGTQRSLSDYERYAGMNFRLRLVQPWTFENRSPPNPEAYESDDEWRSRSFKDFTTRIELHHSEFPSENDCDFFYVGVHDAAGGEIARRDLSTEQVRALRAQRRPHIEFSYVAQAAAQTWLVWPHSRTKGWLDKIQRPLGTTRC